MRSIIFLSIFSLGSLWPLPSQAAVGDAVYETCPEASDIGNNVECYPLTFISKTEVHPDGIPIIGYLFVPTDRPDEPLPAIVFAHGSGSMYSLGHHNDGLNSKHKQWVRQYTSELGYVSLHVSSFHSRYLLPDTSGDQRIMNIDVPPEGLVGGDDYRATSYMGSRDSATRIDVAFDPDPPDDDDVSPNVRWKDSDNGSAGVSEVMERAYDMDAAWDFLAGIRKGRMIPSESRRNEDDRNDSHPEATMGAPMAEIGYIGEIVGGLTVDHQKIFLYGTSHGGQAAMATAHVPRILDPDNPMNTDMPQSFRDNPVRYAAFFDYYGGCGLYGAYGGAGSDSTWRPYAPFVKFSGEYDRTVFDEDTIPIDSPEKFRNENCGQRFDAAYVDVEFDEFLEMVVYDDAFHSFDGVELEDVAHLSPESAPVTKGGLFDWFAKMHANYRVTVPFMDAIRRLVNTDRSFETGPTPDGLGLSLSLPYFSYSTVPVEPNLPPRLRPDEGVLQDGVVPVADLTSFTLDLDTLFKDSFGGFFDITCKGYSLPDNVSLDPSTCVLELSLAEDQLLNEMPKPLAIAISTEKGTRYQPMTVEVVQENSGLLRFGQAIQTLPAGAELGAFDIGGLVVDLRGFAWTEYPATGAHIVNFDDADFGDGYTLLDVDGERNVLLGDLAPDDTPDNTAVFATVDGWAVSLDLDVAETGVDRATVSIGGTLDGFNHDADLFPTPPARGENPQTGFLALPVVSDDTPPPPGEFPDDGGEENQTPVADAGEDQTVTAGDEVTLDGGGSTDAEDDTTALTLSWQQVGGTDITLSGDETAMAIFTAPTVEESETLTFELTVTDTAGASHTDTVIVTVNPPVDGNTAPVADAGDDRTVEAGDSVTLDAGGSNDEEDDSEQLGFAWQQTDGAPVELSATDEAAVSFTAPAVDSVESLVFELTVTDSGGLSGTDSVTIIVNPADGGGNELDGEELYAQHCASCHGSLENSERRDRTAEQIRAAIDADRGGVMGALQLTDEEIEAIAKALASEGPGGGGNDGGGGGSSGGGTLLWLLPFTLLLRRRK